MSQFPGERSDVRAQRPLRLTPRAGIRQPKAPLATPVKRAHPCEDRVRTHSCAQTCAARGGNAGGRASSEGTQRRRPTGGRLTSGGVERNWQIGPLQGSQSSRCSKGPARRKRRRSARSGITFRHGKSRHLCGGGLGGGCGESQTDHFLCSRTFGLRFSSI